MKHWLLWLGVACALGAAVPGSASAQGVQVVTCGSAINTAGIYILGADCSGPGISITADHVVLKLNGHTMTGSGGTGVDVNGVSRVQIHGPGEITSYSLGISLASVSASGIFRVAVVNSSEQGVALYDSSNNELIANVVSGSAFHGITLNGSNHNILSGNQSSDNLANGLFLARSSGNRLNHNWFDGNIGYGVAVQDIGNGPANGNWIRANQASHNAVAGIGLAAGTSGNRVVGNTALANGQYDLVDGDPSCAGNAWSSDLFATANAACIH